MDETNIVAIILSFVITWSIGLLPPVLIRYLFVKRPLMKWPAIGIAICFWFINISIFIALGSQSKSHFALFLIAYVSYWILRYGSETQAVPEAIINVNTDASANWDEGNDKLVEAVKLSISKPKDGVDSVKRILEDGANINAKNGEGFTVLGLARYYECPSVITALLLSAGAES